MASQKTKLIAFFYAAFIFMGGFFVFRAQAATAASLYLSPNSGSYALGKTITMGVYVSSADESVNAFSGTLTFPTDKLQVTSISKAGSIVSLWVQDPDFSNGAGSIRFEGIALNPGYKGTSGKLITVTFKTKAVGGVNVHFTGGQVLANDGSGTNVLAGLGQANYIIKPLVVDQKPAEATTPVAPPSVPLAPLVSSASHPDTSRWYNDNNPEFHWTLPPGIIGLSYAVDSDSHTDPGTKSAGIFSNYTAKRVADGVRYFHIRLQNKDGWGSITHYRFQVDTVAPEPFAINLVDGAETENPTPRFRFHTVDTLSGVAMYKVKINNNDYVTVSPSTTGMEEAVAPPIVPGKHTVIVQAFDRAGNSFTTASDFSIKGLMPPTFTDYPATLEQGNSFVAHGRTYPGVQVTVALSGVGGSRQEQTVMSDPNGDFVFVAPQKLNEGLYQMTGQVTDTRGAKSDYSAPLTVVVQTPPFIRIGMQVISVLAILISFLSLLFLLIFLIWYARHKYKKFRKQVNTEASEAEGVLHQSFNLVRENLKREIVSLQNEQLTRQLTHEEEQVMNQLKNDLEVVERLVTKQIKDIEDLSKN